MQSLQNLHGRFFIQIFNVVKVVLKKHRHKLKESNKMNANKKREQLHFQT